MKIDVEAAKRVFRPIADHFKMSIEAAADSAVQLANANIVRAIQLISTERGYDPRDYVLVPFGGAGPLHAAQIAEDLAIEMVVVPPAAGVMSAYGLIASDFLQFETLTRRRAVGEDAARFLREVHAEMKTRAMERARQMNLPEKLVFDFTAEMRFVGQAFEVPVSFSEKELAKISSAAVLRRFGDEHQKIYFFGANSDKPVEFVSFRLRFTLPISKLPLLTEETDHKIKAADVRMFDGRRWQDGRLVSRGDIKPGKRVKGPALLEDPTSTLLVPTGWTASRDKNDNTILKRKG